MTDTQEQSLQRCVRSLAACAGVGLAGLVFGIWRLGVTMQTLFRDLNVAETWRQGVLSILSTPVPFAISLALGLAISVAASRLALDDALWVTSGTVVLLVSHLVGSIAFFYWLMMFPAISLAR